MSEFAAMRPIDCHVHMRGLSSLVNIVGMLEAAELEAINICAAPGLGGRNLNQNAAALMFKLLHPARFYAFCGLHRVKPDGEWEDFTAQAERMLAAGCDGFKMMAGKPTVYKEHGVPLDDAVYAGYYGLLESRGVPIVYHVADPAAFWDPDKVSEGVRERGWFYGNGTFPTREELHAQVDRMMEKFPKLPVIFAHFYFMSGDLERAAAFLDRWPNVCFDLTPHHGMYHDFLHRPEEAREFFVRYSDRILLGTDNSGGTRAPNPEKVTAAADKIRGIRTVLESDEEVDVFGFKGRGLNLPPEVLSAIYGDNFRRLAGASPQEVNAELALEECDRALSYMQSDADARPFTVELREIRNITTRCT